MKEFVLATDRDRFTAAARHISHAMALLEEAARLAPEGELANLPDLTPWFDAMRRGALASPADGPRSVPAPRGT